VSGIFFIPQVIHEHGEPLWNDVDREKLLIRQPELSGNPTSRVIWWQAGGTGERNDEFVLAKHFCSYLHVILSHAVKCYGMGFPALLSPRRKACCGVLSALKIHRLGRV
jgi:hypothetical protein